MKTPKEYPWPAGVSLASTLAFHVVGLGISGFGSRRVLGIPRVQDSEGFQSFRAFLSAFARFGSLQDSGLAVSAESVG